MLAQFALSLLIMTLMLLASQAEARTSEFGSRKDAKTQRFDIERFASLRLCVTNAPDTLIPKVFIKGQSEKLEELLNQQFPKQILAVYNDDVNASFSACARMVLDLEKYGEQTGFDIRGIKAFTTFYFDRKGNIRHIAYSLKGNSRYFEPEALERFFRQFMNVFHLPINAKYNFQHEFQLIIPLPWIYMDRH